MRALAASPFWPKTYRHDSPEAQGRYDMLANLTGCTGPTSLRCLKAIDVQTIRDASLAVAASHTYGTSSFTWGPVVDDAFLRRPLSKAAFRPGTMHMHAGFATYNTHEGEDFVPPYLKSVPGNSSWAPLREWLTGYLPTFSETDIQRIEMLYPDGGNVESPNDTYARAGMIYRDSVLSCPALWMAGAAPNGGWLSEYTISPAKHASDVYWVSGPTSTERATVMAGTHTNDARRLRSGIRSTQPRGLTNCIMRAIPVCLLPRYSLSMTFEAEKLAYGRCSRIFFHDRRSQCPQADGRGRARCSCPVVWK